MQRTGVSTQTEQFTCPRCCHQQALLAALQLQPVLYHLQQATALLSSIHIPNHQISQHKSLLQAQQQRQPSSGLSPSSLKHSSQQPLSANYADIQDFTKIEPAQTHSHIPTEQTMQFITLINEISGPGLEQKPEKFSFQVRLPIEPKHFSCEGIRASKIQEGQHLRRLTSRFPISNESRQQVGIRIVKTRKGHIYFGLVSEQQAKRPVTVRPMNNSVISYLMEGGRQLYVLSKNEESKVPAIREGETISFRVDVPRRTMQWLSGLQTIHTSQLIDFQGLFWFPFVVLRDAGDAVDLL